MYYEKILLSVGFTRHYWWFFEHNRKRYWNYSNTCIL